MLSDEANPLARVPVSVDENHVLTQLGPVTIGIWRRSVELDRLTRQLEVQREMLKVYPRMGCINVVEATCRPLQSDVSQMLRSAAVEFRGRQHVVTVVESEGLVGTALRALLTAVSAFQSRDTRSAIEADFRVGARLIATALADVPGAPSEALLSAHLVELRSQIPEPAHRVRRVM